MSRARTGIGVAAFAVAIVGCGGGSTKTVTETTATTPSSTPLSKAEFVEKADAICADVNPKVDAGNKAANDAYARGDLQKAADEIRSLVPMFRDAQAQTDALVPPPADKPIVDKIRDVREQEIALAERLADATENGDTSQISSLGDSLDDVGNQLKGLDTGYGFKVCGAD